MSRHLRLGRARRLKKRKYIPRAILQPVEPLRVGTEKVWLSERVSSH